MSCATPGYLQCLELIIKTMCTNPWYTCAPTTWYTFNSQFYQQTDGVAMGGPASSTTAEIYMQAYERTAITTALHPPKVWERFVDDVYSILKRTHLESFFHHINNLHQNIKFTMEEESNGELAFLDTLLKRNNDP